MVDNTIEAIQKTYELLQDKTKGESKELNRIAKQVLNSSKVIYGITTEQHTKIKNDNCYIYINIKDRISNEIILPTNNEEIRSLGYKLINKMKGGIKKYT